MQQSLEDTLTKKVEAAKEAVKLKYFKEFCAAEPEAIHGIWAKMKALESLSFDLSKAIRKPE